MYELRRRVQSRSGDFEQEIRTPEIRKRMLEAARANQRALNELSSLLGEISQDIRFTSEGTKGLLKNLDQTVSNEQAVLGGPCTGLTAGLRVALSRYDYLNREPIRKEMGEHISRLSEFRRSINTYPELRGVPFDLRQALQGIIAANDKDINKMFSEVYLFNQVTPKLDMYLKARSDILQTVAQFKTDLEKSRCAQPNLSGPWKDDWGYVIELNHQSGAITGTFTKGNNVGKFTGGGFNSFTCEAVIDYEEPWKQSKGKVTLVLSKDGMTLAGSYISTIPGYSSPQKGGWTLTRRFEPGRPSPTVIGCAPR
jgi:hypothetical protein